jgi:hypothetical protein
MTKCEENASTSCAAQADERQILPVIRLLFIRRCVTEALGG